MRTIVRTHAHATEHAAAPGHLEGCARVDTLTQQTKGHRGPQ
nr:hypothetical protein [Xanthomonas axonopodis]